MRMKSEKRIGSALPITDVEQTEGPADATRTDAGITPEGYLVVDANEAGPVEWQVGFNRFLRAKRRNSGDDDAALAETVRVLADQIDELENLYQEHQRQESLAALEAELDEIERTTTHEQRKIQAYAKWVLNGGWQ